MFVDFIEIWIIILVSTAVTSALATMFVLVTTGHIQSMDGNAKGELRSFSMIILGGWSIGISLLLTQLIIIVS